jgi:hypothetical protein
VPDIAFHPLFPLDMGPLHYFSVLGRALFTAQHLEMNCRAIEGFLYMRQSITLHGPSGIESPSFQKDIEKLWRKTLGQHVHNLCKKDVLSGDAITTLKSAVDARNEIAHQVAIDVSERLNADLGQRIEYILGLVRSIAEADKIASAILHMLNKDPLPTKDFFASYEDRVVAWVSEATFEE